MQTLQYIWELIKSFFKLPVLKERAEQYEKIRKLQIENENLTAENSVLKENTKIKGMINFHNNAYWLNREGNEEGPYCPKCYDADNKLIRMLKGQGRSAYADCPHCKTVSQIAEDTHYRHNGAYDI